MNGVNVDEAPQSDSSLNTHLADFDWKLKLCVSSDKLASVDNALLNVDFNLKTNDKITSTVPIELDYAELTKLIEKLETAQAAVSAMKAQLPLNVEN